MLKEREEDPEATFHPQTLQYERQPGATHGDKCLDLYSRWQTNTKISRLQGEPEALNAKEREECTHRPAINEYGTHLARPQQSLSEIKGFKEKMAQMKKGRRQHEA